ncbi:MAG: hypothetical protein KIS92_03195 [Planctomycetota bacterium]|nr:hypothetical protein [Planctomycetota bacterium]
MFDLLSVDLEEAGRAIVRAELGQSGTRSEDVRKGNRVAGEIVHDPFRDPPVPCVNSHNGRELYVESVFVHGQSFRSLQNGL